MSEPIIIETPAPPTRERLVLVRERIIVPESRDATPADLERAGYVPSVGYLPRREVETAVSDAMDLQRRLDRMTEVAEQNLERFETAESELSAETIRADEWKAKCIEAEANLGAAESANAECHELIASETARAEKAERERDEARRLHSDAEAQVACRNELRAQVAAAEGRFRAAEAERDTLRAELARLTAPGDVGLLNSELVEAIRPGQEYTHRGFDVVELRAAYRLGVAHERARLAAAGVTLATADEASDEAVAADLRAAGVDPEALAARWLAFVRECQRQLQGRATDEELVDLYRKAYETHGGRTIDVSHDDCRRAAILAAAARVRQERCLVAQAVAADCDIHVTEQISGMWCVRVVAQTSSTAAGVSATVPRADAPSTLARLLGEVSRG